ncbi:MAG: hypothetical protein SFT92_06900 [Rickettsiales bacterium]|nr:hypothetical protein [Rickettsiales bacterium]
MKRSLQQTLLAEKIGKKPDEVPDILLQLLAETTPQRIKNNPQFNLEELGVTAAELEEWFAAFARGAQYVYEKYGVIFEGMYVGRAITSPGNQETDNAVLYDANNDLVAITRRYVANEIKHTRGHGAIFGTANTDHEKQFTGLELATLVGVEEAFHAYQFKVLGHQYSDDDKNGLNDLAAIKNNDEHYATNAIEKDARDVIRQAIKDFGFGGRAK